MNNSQYTFDQRINKAMRDLAISGKCDATNMARSTMYRWANEINYRLRMQGTDDRVKVDYKNRRLVIE